MERKIQVTPWPHEDRGRTLTGTTMVCTYLLDVFVDAIEETLLLHRTKDQDELLIASEFCCGVAATKARDREGPAEAAVKLTGALIRSRVGFGWPSKCLIGGIVGREQFHKLVADIRAELEANRRQQMKTRIVEVADELGLYPAPSGNKPAHWTATCPGTNHLLYLDTNREQFYCGYCRRKGGRFELGQFVADRRGRDMSRNRAYRC